MPNYVPHEFEPFMDSTVQEWINTGVLAQWDKIKSKNKHNDKPTTIMPLGVKPSKPRATWDGRFVNEHCRNIPFIMDSVGKVAELSWEGAYFSN